MAKLTFKTDLCKGCGLCVSACPKKLLVIAKDKINQKGYHPAEMTDAASAAAANALAFIDMCLLSRGGGR